MASARPLKTLAGGGVTTPSRVMSSTWEDLRKEARKLEGELDVKLVSFSKLSSGYAGSLTMEGGSGDTPELLSATKAAEIESLLRRLGDVNAAMAACIGAGSSEVLTHTLARHRDILHEFTQEFRRTRSSVNASRDHAELLMGFDRDSSNFAGANASTSAQLLRERGNIHSSTSQMDEVIDVAESTSSVLQQQRLLFMDVNSKLGTLGAKFPVVNSLLTMIRRKKSKDTMILAAVIAVCTLLLILYWWNK
eukprot:jgi/Chlat1/7043/Chrsp56S06673